MRLEAVLSLANGRSARQHVNYTDNENPLLVVELEGFGVFVARSCRDVRKLHVVVVQDGNTALNHEVDFTPGKEVELYLRVQGVHVRIHPAPH